jgi:hypothetical protein
MKAKSVSFSVIMIGIFFAPALAQDYGKEHYSPNSPYYMAGQKHYLIKNETSSPMKEQQPVMDKQPQKGQGPGKDTAPEEEAIIIAPLPVGGVLGFPVKIRR